MSRPLLGILRLDTRFPRLPGDVASPETWPFEVAVETVAGADVAGVTGGADWLAPFAEAADRLVGRGVRAITTSCGFLVRYQAELAARLPVPVLTSSLLLIPLIRTALPADRRVGVVTFDARRLDAAHLRAAGAPADTPVAGIEDGRELHRVIAGDLPRLDPAAAEADVVAAGLRLRETAPDLGAVVLECANMPPYAAALAARLGLPVYDIVGAVRWLCAGLAPPAWPPPGPDRAAPGK